MCSATAYLLHGYADLANKNYSDRNVFYNKDRRKHNTAHLFQNLYNLPDRVQEIVGLFRENIGHVMRHSLCLKHLLPAVHASLVFNVLPPVSCLLKKKTESQSEK